MKTLHYKNTYTSAITNETVFDIRVSKNSGCSVHVLPGDATTVVKTQMVFIDPVTGQESDDADYDTFDSSVEGTGLWFFNYQYKIPWLRVVIVSTGTTGTIHITADVWE